LVSGSLLVAGSGYHTSMVYEPLIQKDTLSSIIFFSSGEWIRTTDLRVMSPTSYHCSTPRCVDKYTTFTLPRQAGCLAISEYNLCGGVNNEYSLAKID
jgi:hypothetical protein